MLPVSLDCPFLIGLSVFSNFCIDDIICNFYIYWGHEKGRFVNEYSQLKIFWLSGYQDSNPQTWSTHTDESDRVGTLDGDC